MQNKQLLYGFIGAVSGGILVWFLLTNTVTGSMMGMMGLRQLGDVSRNNQMMTGNMDRMFIEGMVPHHESAINMAKMALEKSRRNEIKELSNSIIKSQSEEIMKMKQWYKVWFGAELSKSAMGGSKMMSGGMMGSVMDNSSLANASDFDKEFLTQMTTHHRMAIMMAQMMLSGTKCPEMKQLGQDIIAAQTKEINQMQTWYKAWYQVN